jgi:hypothetical protein
MLAQGHKEHDKIQRGFVALLGKTRSTKEKLEIQQGMHENEQARREKIAEAQKKSAGLASWTGALTM